MAAPSRTEAFAPAKINLFLHVGDKRADGYHALESLVVFVDEGDRLICETADALSLTIEGPFAAGLAGEGDNLVLRAARALGERAGHKGSAAITLIKNLPVASGIGGGSADAAAALRGLAQLWGVDGNPVQLRAIAEGLGSDVPVCLESRASWMEGRGEIVTPADGVPSVAMLLVNPGVAVPTAPVFRALETRTGVGRASRTGFGTDARGLADYLATTRNDLEAPALQIAPVIGDVLAALRAQPGVLLARMSGSGATCFGIFVDYAQAKVAASAMAQAHSGWWVKPARVIA